MTEGGQRRGADVTSAQRAGKARASERSDSSSKGNIGSVLINWTQKRTNQDALEHDPIPNALSL